MHLQVSNKLSSDGDGTHIHDGKQVHIHLTMGNLAGCFLNFGSADSSSFPFPGRPEA
jgi:hypothetical protein